ncbi:MAG: 5-formyltetrahydrofolate cyclo-ligase [Thermonemataceae bacterium]|nr:5-formyltetrahydrofolate cyclo-ligase [Thermonemataceae bacterium]
MLKSEIRKLYKSKRMLLSEQDIDEQSLKISWQLEHWLSGKYINFLHTFLPIKRQREINTFIVIERLRKLFPSIKIGISHTNFAEKTLSHFLLEEHSPLQEDEWGIPQVLDKQPFLIEKAEIILVPLLAFDNEGFRVGYGAGFYDRLLSQCPQAKRVGLSFFPPLPQLIEDTDNYDIPLHICISPEEIFTFSQTI